MSMRRVKAILAALAVMVMMMANAAPAMADGWWENCDWNFSPWWGWFLTCDWNPGSDSVDSWDDIDDGGDVNSWDDIDDGGDVWDDLGGWDW
jgi:hypothetical protein